MDSTAAERHKGILSAGRWFKGLPEELQRGLLREGVVRALAAGDRLFSRGDPPSGLYAVLDGAVRITAVAESGKEVLLTLAEPPSWFGEIAVFDGQERTHDAVAGVESLVMQVPQRALDAMLEKEPRYWRELGMLLAAKLRLVFAVMEESAALPMSVRLARRILLMAEGYGEWEDRSRRVIQARQEQLGMMLSTSRQTVNQLLKELEAAGAVKVSYGQVEIVDLELLRRAAKMEGG